MYERKREPTFQNETSSDFLILWYQKVDLGTNRTNSYIRKEVGSRHYYYFWEFGHKNTMVFSRFFSNTTLLVMKDWFAVMQTKRGKMEARVKLRLISEVGVPQRHGGRRSHDELRSNESAALLKIPSSRARFQAQRATERRRQGPRGRAFS